jgi:DNA-binding transcriptional LysR family regulator
MDIPWDDVRLFLTVAECSSMTAAAKKLSLGQPTISRRLQELEARLGYSLFERSVHGATLTAAGERLVVPARRMAEWAAEVSRSADDREGPLRGLVRLTAPPLLAAEFLAPFARHVRDQLPGVELEVLSAVGSLDLVRREADIALRRERPSQRDLVVVQSVTAKAGLFATPAFRRRLPKDRAPTLAEVAAAGIISWAAPYEHLSPTAELKRMIPDFRPVFASNDILVQRAAAEASVGAIVLSRARHRFSPPTKLVLLDVPLGDRAVGTSHLVVAKSALLVPTVRAVVELLQAEMQATETASAS